MANMKSNKKGRWARKRERERSKVVSYRKTGRLRLQKMFSEGKGRSRSDDKEKGRDKRYIYSESTFKTYKQQFKHFADWLSEAHSEVVTLDEARAYVDDYLRYLMKLERSSYTLTTVKATLAKVFECSSTEFVKTPPRRRADIKRSRNEVKRDKNISQKVEDKFAVYTSALGLRRFEMLNLRSEHLFFKNGIPHIHVPRGKGGKSRDVQILGRSDEETRDIIRFIKSKKGRVFPTLPSHFDNHHYRAVYATRLYKHLARNVDEIPRTEKYIMRHDRAGEVLDKIAMKKVSQALGHNRIQVIAQSYLYEL